MPEEATLDAFAGEADASTDEPEDAAEGGDGADGPTTGTDGDREAVPPAAVTSSWDGAGTACSSCGEPAARLWEEAGERVCTACKPW